MSLFHSLLYFFLVTIQLLKITFILLKKVKIISETFHESFYRCWVPIFIRLKERNDLSLIEIWKLRKILVGRKRRRFVTDLKKSFVLSTINNLSKTFHLVELDMDENSVKMMWLKIIRISSRFVEDHDWDE